jgi:hypothetical protein
MDATFDFTSLLLCFFIETNTSLQLRRDFGKILKSVNPNIQYPCDPDYIIALQPDGTRTDMFNYYADEEDYTPTKAFIDQMSNPTTVFCLSSDNWYLSLRVVNGVIQFCQTDLYSDDADFVGDHNYGGLKFHKDGWFNLVDVSNN